MYILQLLRNGKYYVGSTLDLDRRIKEHQAGKTEYVRKYISPFNLVFSQSYDDIGRARAVEMWLKLQKDRDFLQRIIFEGIIKKDV